MWWNIEIMKEGWGERGGVSRVDGAKKGKWGCWENNLDRGGGFSMLHRSHIKSQNNSKLHWFNRSITVTTLILNWTVELRCGTHACLTVFIASSSLVKVAEVLFPVGTCCISQRKSEAYFDPRIQVISVVCSFVGVPSFLIYKPSPSTFLFKLFLEYFTMSKSCE